MKFGCAQIVDKNHWEIKRQKAHKHSQFIIIYPPAGSPMTGSSSCGQPQYRWWVQTLERCQLPGEMQRYRCQDQHLGRHKSCLDLASARLKLFTSVCDGISIPKIVVPPACLQFLQSEAAPQPLALVVFDRRAPHNRSQLLQWTRKDLPRLQSTGCTSHRHPS